jgi:hypothetical protein
MSQRDRHASPPSGRATAATTAAPYGIFLEAKNLSPLGQGLPYEAHIGSIDFPDYRTATALSSELDMTIQRRRYLLWIIYVFFLLGGGAFSVPCKVNSIVKRHYAEVAF